jgi:hypothetical protein
MDKPVAIRRGETDTHVRLKRLALLWAQANGYSACAAEVSLPQCRYRADVAAYRPQPNQPGVTAVFECKQALPDLRRDNCCSDPTRERLRSLGRRRAVLERQLRIHYPTLRAGDSLFPEYDSHDFAALGHHSYNRVLREFTALQNRLNGGRKFECLVRYGCANLFFLVLPNELFCESEVPLGWGALVESDETLALVRKPIWRDNAVETRFRLLQRIATAGTRQFNRAFGISHEEIVAAAKSIWIRRPGRD